MKILILSSYLDAWNSVRPEAEMFIEMARLGHDVTVMTQEKADYVSRFREHGVHVVDCYPKRKVCFEAIKKIRAELKRQHYDIVYAMNSKTIPNAAFACIGFKETKLVTYRGTVGGLYRHDPSAYLTHLHPRVDGIVCVAQAVTDSVREHVWKNREFIQTIHKGHDLSWYHAEKASLAELSIAENSTVAVCIANARLSKGVHVLLDSMKQLSDLDNFHLLLVGRDMDTASNLQLAKESGMENRIHFAGYRTDVPNLLAASDIQVQPSISGEGLPKTIIEAMAMAVPSVVTTTGGSKELIIDGQTGFVVATNDPKALAEKIRYLNDNPDERALFGTKAQKLITTEFSVQNTATQHLNFFSRLMEPSK